LIKINSHFRNAVIVTAIAFGSIAVQAETVNLKATLNTASEVPAKTGDGSGTLTATLDTSTHELKYHVDFTGLSGPATAAHFHGPAAAGANAGPQVPVKTTPIASPIEGTATLTPAQEKDLMDGKWYFNVHTKANPGGEIRGQVEASK
jgi:hypothetical protein